ncbi:uncharacterized protein LOC106072763 [Biomphalaria glabrata]|uniref:Uncharacterized protein LOC106072763 n=1 Tax=Biomphalaria glabrata TaxID=6526 RepID=A0A9W2ZF67_BIOGL|nr:uncharacterized protein LOC106072763 [Biomphalaria glabrata]
MEEVDQLFEVSSSQASAPPGFKDTVNISLLGLAVSDLLSLITALWVAICWNPLMYYADLPFIPEDVDYLTGSLPHLLFTRVTAWITAFVALERCLCIAIPLHVKTIVTPSRVAIYIVCTFVVVTGAQAGSFYTSSLEWVFNSLRNRTIMSRVWREGSQEIESITYSVNLVFPFGSFIIVVVCTAISAIQLRRKSKWRMKTTMAKSTRKDNEADVVSKEKKVIKLVVMISVIFIVSFLPSNIIHITYCSIASQPELVYFYWPYLSISYSFVKILEAFNASISIVLYYVMSSKFRNNFYVLFGVKTTFKM